LKSVFTRLKPSQHGDRCVDIAAEGYVGANLEGAATATWDPLVARSAWSRIGIFAGGRAEARPAPIWRDGLDSVGVGVQGAVSYGIGGKFDADIGITTTCFVPTWRLVATLAWAANSASRLNWIAGSSKRYHRLYHRLTNIGNEWFGGEVGAW